MFKYLGEAVESSSVLKTLCGILGLDFNFNSVQGVANQNSGST